MAFDQPTRNRLQKFVSEARSLLTVEFTRQLQNDYGLDPESGNISPIEVLTGLDDERLSTAKILRETFNHYQSTTPGENTKDLLERIVREQAFTMLNRFAAIRMAEARGILFESISKGYQSKGFQLYSRVAGSGLGSTFDAYRNYIFSVFDELALDLAVLFDRFSPFGRLFPRQAVLEELLAFLNDPEIDHLWTEDETIGWIYQYFNSKDERKKMRDESAAPRNSRELAVRNQFFTPRYVVEFLTDNTLGRTWYEMTRGDTALVERCRCLVRRPNEIFLNNGENAPLETEESNENLTQDELLKQPVYIPHRPLKDPREILMLDPACGSMHFGLYAFDLFLAIYDEAWDLEETKGADVFTRSQQLKPLRETYENNKEWFIRDVPRLIIENNIHGVDIDPRAVQIAGLSLWLRAQRAWADQNVKPIDRPQIQRSNIVCAEPMPGEANLLEEFITKHFGDTPEKRLLGEFVRRIFDSMRLSGEAGSLLKIEEEVANLISESREQWHKLQQQKQSEHPELFEGARVNVQPGLDFEVSKITDAQFWDKAEGEIYKALRRYSEASEDGPGYQRRLFSDDAAQGFAFIDICRKRYDVVVMNPPFGELATQSKPYIFEQYSDFKSDVYAAFVIRGIELLKERGRLGAITSRTGFFLSSLQKWRQFLIRIAPVREYVDLGLGVLDAATVEACCFSVEKHATLMPSTFINCLGEEEKAEHILDSIQNAHATLVHLSNFDAIPTAPFAYWAPASLVSVFKQYRSMGEHGFRVRQGLGSSDNFRFLRAWWEIPSGEIGPLKRWYSYAKGGGYQPFWGDQDLCVLWKNDGNEIKEKSRILYGTWSKQITNVDYYGRPGLTYASRLSDFAPRILPAGSAFDTKGSSIFDDVSPNDSQLLLKLLVVVQSTTFRALLSMCVARAGQLACSYPEALVEKIPIPPLERIPFHAIQRALELVSATAYSEQEAEETHAFVRPVLEASLLETANALKTLTQSRKSKFNEAVADLDDNVRSAYGLLTTVPLDSVAGAILSQRFALEEDFVNHGENVIPYVFSWILGVVFGRWDIRYATGELPSPELPDPFTPLPVCPPGMLQNGIGLPATPEDVPTDYPVEIVWNGILIDDAGNPNDIENRLREVLQLIWKDRAEAIESETCEILGVRALRDYFRKSAGFFADHLKRYSKSRRQAPIYLPLSTKSGGYTLWLYYHRLTDQTLYTCVNDFVDPKLRQLKEEVVGLRSKPERTQNDEKRLENLTELLFELEELRNELLRFAPIWKPNLNDGVQITVSPLWKLFGLPKWRKTLEDTWKKLEKGDYDWAHLAYSFFPERVREKCRHDKSLAIAHDLEDLYEERPAKSHKARTKQAQTAALPLADS